jgi:glycosyltransferase involved in cell wall biosynthesis
MQDVSPEVSVLMPCLNEQDTLQSCIDEAKQAIKAAGVSGEIVIADNGSTDDSVQIAEANGARVVHVRRKGYGSALMQGIVDASGTYVLMGDADGSYDFGSLRDFLVELRRGNELVMGCRLRRCGGTIEPGAMPWLHRWIGNPILSWLGRLFFKASVADFHCGLRGFKREAVINLGLQCTGMEFASEMVVKSVNAGLRISEIPITLRPDGRSRSPHLRSWRDGWRHLRFMLLYSPRWLYLVPGAFLLLSGLVGFVALLFGPVQIGNVEFDTNTLLVSSAAIIVGSQLLFFSVYMKSFAVKSGLLPYDKRVDRLLNSPVVELGIFIGLLLVLVGVAFIGAAMRFWGAADYGPIPYSEGLRMVIPGVTSISLGVMCMFSGFLLELLNIESKHMPDIHS